jgi:hypothetical protein
MDLDVRLSKNFKLREFLVSQEATRKGMVVVPSEAELENLRRLCVEVLQPVRDLYGRMQITSGLRPTWLNNMVGGSQSSAHIYGCAADVEFLDFDNSYVFGHLHDFTGHNLPVDQIIAEFLPEGWIHFGIARVGAHPRGQYLRAKHGSNGKTEYEFA